MMITIIVKKLYLKIQKNIAKLMTSLKAIVMNTIRNALIMKEMMKAYAILIYLKNMININVFLKMEDVQKKKKFAQIIN